LLQGVIRVSGFAGFRVLLVLLLGCSSFLGFGVFRVSIKHPEKSSKPLKCSINP
jgi:hypothetical protein